MADIAGADSQGDITPEAEAAGFEAEFSRLGTEERQAEEARAADDPDAGKDKAGEPAGQGSDAPPKDDALAGGPSAPEKSTDDIWADAPEHLKQAHFDALSQKDQAVRTQTGRLSTALNELKTLKSNLSGQRDATGATKEGEEATDRTERLKQLREEFPEVAAPILDVIQSLEARVNGLGDLESARTSAQVEQVQDQQEALVEDVHPGLLAKIGGELETEFRTWAEQQPRYVIDGINRNGSGVVDANETIDILNRFAASRGGSTSEADQLAERRKRQLEAGRLPGSRQPAITPKDKPDDFEAEFKRLGERERQRATR